MQHHRQQSQAGEQDMQWGLRAGEERGQALWLGRADAENQTGIYSLARELAVKQEQNLSRGCSQGGLEHCYNTCCHWQ